MKKILILLLSLVLVLCFASCGGSTDNPPETCTKHTDTDGDKKCDTCGATVESPECTTHTDTDGNGKCDACGAELENDEGEDVTVKLIEDGVCNFKFVIGTGVNSSLRMEIDDLVSALGNIGIETEYVNDTANNVSECEVLIGDVKARGDEYKFDKYSLGLEGYAIKPVGTKVIISAGDDAKLIDAFRLFVSDVLGFEDGETEELTDVSLSTKDEIVEIQDNYNITSLTLLGQSLKGATIAVDRNTSVYHNVAKNIQQSFYKYTGNYLPIVSISDASTSSVVVSKVEDDGEYGYKVFVKDGKLHIECGFDNAFESATKDFIETAIIEASGAVDFGSTYTYNKEVRIVRYEDFGAKGDGRTNDFPALVEAHEYANKGGQTVVAKEGASYYIKDLYVNGEREIIEIRTNVIWTGATFIIDDRDLSGADKNNKGVFAVRADEEKYSITDKNTLYSIFPDGKISVDTTKVNYATGKKLLLIITDYNHKNYIRSGSADYDGIGNGQQELIVIDGEGNLVDNTQFMFDYEDITSIDVHNADETPITIKGGTIRTLASQKPCTDKATGYLSRGFGISRSNVTIDGLVHEVEGEEELRINGEKRHAYSGFLSVSNANNVNIINVTLVGRRSAMHGTYDFSAGNSNMVTLYKCVQSNFYDENGKPTLDYTNYWGIGGTNYCKNLTYDTCVLSRFDAHCGVYNGKIINSTVSNIEIIGKGSMYLENTIFAYSTHPPIMLRGDYGCTWDGTLTLKNCTIDATYASGTNKTTLINGGWSNWYYGYVTHFPNVEIDNLKWIGLPDGVNSVMLAAFNKTELVSEKTLSDGTENKNPYMPPEFIKIINNNQGIDYKLYDVPFFAGVKTIGITFVPVR